MLMNDEEQMPGPTQMWGGAEVDPAPCSPTQAWLPEPVQPIRISNLQPMRVITYLAHPQKKTNQLSLDNWTNVGLGSVQFSDPTWRGPDCCDEGISAIICNDDLDIGSSVTHLECISDGSVLTGWQAAVAHERLMLPAAGAASVASDIAMQDAEEPQVETDPYMFDDTIMQDAEDITPAAQVEANPYMFFFR